MIACSEKMASKRDGRCYFGAKENESKRSRISIPEIIITAADKIMLAKQRLILQKKRL